VSRPAAAAHAKADLSATQFDDFEFRRAPHGEVSFRGPDGLSLPPLCVGEGWGQARNDLILSLSKDEYFGVVLARAKWQALAERLRDAGADSLIEPGIRFAGKSGEQATMFIRDPSGNALKFKSFRDPSQLFAP
jgi:hypothetical protein